MGLTMECHGYIFVDLAVMKFFSEKALVHFCHILSK